MDRVDLFRVFASVIECGNFRRAANTLGIAPSSVTAAIKELEARMGVQLISRTTRKANPTVHGSALYERCVRVISDFNAIETLFRQTSQEPAGTLRVDLSRHLGRYVVVPALPDFLLRYPEVNVAVNLGDCPVDQAKDHADCIVRLGDSPVSGMIARPLCEVLQVTVASPNYLSRYAAPLSLMPQTLDAPARGAAPATHRISALDYHDSAVTMTATSRIFAQSTEAALACALAGLGVFQMPVYEVQSYLDKGELIAVMPGNSTPWVPITLFYTPTQDLSPAVHVFANWIDGLLQSKRFC